MEFVDAAFCRKVYEIVMKIPVGKVATYGQIAEMLGDLSIAREVGYAMSRAPVSHSLPCHRVVNRTGTLAPEYVFGGQEKQRAMLEGEGIAFLSDGRIDMSRHLWGEPEQLGLF